ncbi:MAG: hypothetical protein AAF499_08990 [Pseudomonadota bacterium]
MNQFISVAVAEKLTTVEALESMDRRAKRADMKSFKAILRRRKPNQSDSG